MSYPEFEFEFQSNMGTKMGVSSAAIHENVAEFFKKALPELEAEEKRRLSGGEQVREDQKVCQEQEVLQGQQVFQEQHVFQDQQLPGDDTRGLPSSRPGPEDDEALPELTLNEVLDGIKQHDIQPWQVEEALGYPLPDFDQVSTSAISADSSVICTGSSVPQPSAKASLLDEFMTSLDEYSKALILVPFAAQQPIIEPVSSPCLL